MWPVDAVTLSVMFGRSMPRHGGVATTDGEGNAVTTLIQPPRDLTSPEPDNAPAKSAPVDRKDLRLAAFHATKVYPGVVGELISDELLAVEGWGYALAVSSRAHRLAVHVLSLLPPEPK